MLVIELKSEALKERHWKTLMKRLHVNWVPSELTLGQVWDVDLQKNEMVVKDVMLVAQGEMALEEFLKQVNTTLTSGILLKFVQDLCRIYLFYYFYLHVLIILFQLSLFMVELAVIHLIQVPIHN
jgi:dynein heavy chain 1